MDKNKNTNRKQYPNRLTAYRRRMKLSQRFVAQLLGHANPSQLSCYEHGRALPTLTTALRLEAIYRVPVAFLFPNLYEHLRNEVRALECEAAATRNAVLF